MKIPPMGAGGCDHPPPQLNEYMPGLAEDLAQLKGLPPAEHRAGMKAIEDKYDIQLPPPPPPPPPPGGPEGCHKPPPPPPVFDWEDYDEDQLSEEMAAAMNYLKSIWLS